MAVRSVSAHGHSDTGTGAAIDNGRGAVLSSVFSPIAKGFSPIELLAASLAACMDASVRIAARREGISPLGALDVAVIATKAEGAPSRLQRFDVTVTFANDIAPEIKARLVAAAEDICTVSNTLRAADNEVRAKGA